MGFITTTTQKLRKPVAPIAIELCFVGRFSEFFMLYRGAKICILSVCVRVTKTGCTRATGVAPPLYSHLKKTFYIFFPKKPKRGPNSQWGGGGFRAPCCACFEESEEEKVISLFIYFYIAFYLRNF